MKLLLITIIFGLTFIPQSFSDPEPLRNKVFSSDGRFYVEMGAEGHRKSFGKGRGIINHVIPGRGVQMLWSVRFYAKHVILSNDGRRLIVFNPDLRRPKDPMLLFYLRGDLVRSYSFRDVLKWKLGKPRKSLHPEQLSWGAINEKKKEFTFLFFDKPLTFDLAGEIKKP